MVLISDSI